MWGGGGGRPYDSSYQGGKRRGCEQAGLSWFPHPLYSFSFGLSFAYLLFCWKTSLDKKLDLADPNNLLIAGE